jgi:hypothetical protein
MSEEEDRYQKLDREMEASGVSAMSGMHYDRNGLPVTFGEWARRFEDQEYKRIAWTDFGPVQVSTVWLGINHNFAGEGEPIIFETMIFGGPEALDQSQWRYSTEEEARAGHEHACHIVRDVIFPESALRKLLRRFGIGSSKK